MKKYGKRVLGAMFFLMIVGYIVWSQLQINQLKNDFIIVAGKITGIANPGWKNSGDYSLLYEYQVAGRLYKGNDNYNFCEGQNRQKIGLLLINNSFPVAYSNKYNNISMLILTRKQAEKINYKIPDSLLVYDSVLTCK